MTFLGECGFLLTVFHIPFPFVDFALCLFTVINHNGDPLVNCWAWGGPGTADAGYISFAIFWQVVSCRSRGVTLTFSALAP